MLLIEFFVIQSIFFQKLKALRLKKNLISLF